MRWFKVAAVALGVLAAFLVISSVLGFIIEAVIAVLVAAVVVLGVKAAFHRGQVSGKRSEREVRGPAHDSPPRRRQTPDIDDELARLKRDMG